MADARVISGRILDELRDAASDARSVVVVAPFITSAGMEVILEALPTTGTVTVYTRWRASDVAAGVSDPRILERLVGSGGRVFLMDSLHAKLYLFDDTIAFVGSANLTQRGLGTCDPCNLEILAVLDPPPTSVFVFLRHLAQMATEATKEDARRILEAAKRVPASPGFEDVRIDRGPQRQSLPFPNLRAPERLYSLYRNVACALTLDERAQALDDLQVLGIRDGMTCEQFGEAVRFEVLRNSLIDGLDRFLAQPRRFGEITDWLKTRDAYASHQACQRQAQTIIRWLLHFFPQRYRLGQPHYSEVLERVRS